MYICEIKNEEFDNYIYLDGGLVLYCEKQEDKPELKDKADIEIYSSSEPTYYKRKDLNIKLVFEY